MERKMEGVEVKVEARGPWAERGRRGGRPHGQMSGWHNVLPANPGLRVQPNHSLPPCIIWSSQYPPL